MRRWETVAYSQWCGFCRAHLTAGVAVEVILLPGVTRKRYRCAACAETPMPEVIPPMTETPERVEWTPPSAYFGDWKSRQVGEDDA